MIRPEECHAVIIDGDPVRVRGAADLSPEAREALEALVAVARAQLAAEQQEAS